MTTQSHSPSATIERPPQVEFFLASLRVVSARHRLAAHELDWIGIALKEGRVTLQEAIEWTSDHGFELLQEVRR